MPNLMILYIEKENKHRLYCENCGEPLEWDDEYNQTYGTCDMYCYAELVGVNLHSY